MFKIFIITDDGLLKEPKDSIYGQAEHRFNHYSGYETKELAIEAIRNEGKTYNDYLLLEFISHKEITK